MSITSPVETERPQQQTLPPSFALGGQDWLLAGFVVFFLLFCAIVLGFILIAA